MSEPDKVIIFGLFLVIIAICVNTGLRLMPTSDAVEDQSDVGERP